VAPEIEENLPSMQFSQLMEEGAALKDPGLQEVHEVERGLVAWKPAGQEAQEPLLVLEFV
jgi:hypothetical protein